MKNLITPENGRWHARAIAAWAIIETPFTDSEAVFIKAAPILVEAVPDGTDDGLIIDKRDRLITVVPANCAHAIIASSSGNIIAMAGLEPGCDDPALWQRLAVEEEVRENEREGKRYTVEFRGHR